MDRRQRSSSWSQVLKLMGEERIPCLGAHSSYLYKNSPREFIGLMNYYKFAAKMIGFKKRVLDIGCIEGLGTWLLAVECGFAMGIDNSCKSVKRVSQIWKDPRISFKCADIFSLKPSLWDAVVSFDVFKQIPRRHFRMFMSSIAGNIAEDGVGVFAAVNRNSYSFKRLEQAVSKVFKYIFLFHMTNELIYAGYSKNAQHLIVLGCKRRI